MYLSFLQKKNPELIDFAGSLIKTGSIEPDSYILDLDAIEDNALRLSKTADDSGITLYFMSKQIGRNPEVARRVLKYGFKGMVAVDYRELLSLNTAGIPVSHAGHLVQIPEKLLSTVLEIGPEVVTVYSLEKAERISRKAIGLGLVQDLLLRVTDKKDIIYPGQEGGFSLENLLQAAEKIRQMKGVSIAGVTTFPCFLYSEEKKKAFPTENVSTLKKAIEMLYDEFGIVCRQINMPSCNSLATIPMIAELGGTHAEPGHSLTGTNPDNIHEKDPLKPAIVYTTEISHHSGYNSLCFGGGYYRRSRLANALVITPDGNEKTSVFPLNNESIDYHFSLKGRFPVGAPVLMAFRTQIFVTRSRVVLVEGLSTGKPLVIGTWDSQGNKINQGGIV